MKHFLQWTRRNPQDWVLVASAAAWADLPVKADPVADVSVISDPLGVADGDALVNNVNGWPFAVNVQGVSFSDYDHYAVEDLSDNGMRLTAWWDDPIWWPLGVREVHAWTFLPLAPDPSVGGQLNTRISWIVYADPARLAVLQAGEVPPPEGQYRPFSEWPGVPPLSVKHGIHVSDAMAAAHRAARTEHGWREWT